MSSIIERKYIAEKTKKVLKINIWMDKILLMVEGMNLQNKEENNVPCINQYVLCSKFKL